MALLTPDQPEFASAVPGGLGGAPDPFDRIIKAISTGFAQQQQMQGRTGIKTDATSSQELENILAKAVEQGMSQAMITEGKGSVPKVSNPHVPSTSKLPSPMGKTPEVGGMSFRHPRGTQGAIQAASQYLGNAVARRAPEQMTQAAGEHMKAQIPETSTLGDYNQETGTWKVTHASGVTEDVAPTPDTQAKITSTTQSIGKKASALSGALSGHATGQGILQGIKGGLEAGGFEETAAAMAPLGVALPAIGAAYEAAQLPGQLQRAAAPYQSIYAGSEGAGLQQAAAGKMYGVSQFFGMGSGAGEQAFNDVSQLGISGSTRSNDLGTVGSLYNKLGVSVQQSVKLITQATQNGNLSLSGLADSITSVSEAAKTASTNAAAAREVFGQTMGGLTSSGVVQNTASQGVAAALTNFQTAGGQTMEGSNLAAGLTSSSMMGMMAAQSGQTPEAIQALAASPGGNQQYLSTLNTTMNTVLNPAIQMALPAVKQAIAQWKSIGITTAKDLQQNPDLITNLIQTITASDSTGSWLAQCQALAGATGNSSMTATQAAQLVVMQAIQQVDPSFATGLGAQVPGAGVNGKLSSSNTSAVKNLLSESSSGGIGGNTSGLVNTKDTGLMSTLQSAGVSVNKSGVVGSMSTAQKAYLSYASSGNDQNSALASLAGSKREAEQKFQVKDPKTGKKIDVSYEDLLKNKGYVDQVNQGTVRFASGSGLQGQTIQEVTNTAGQQKASGKGTSGTITIAPTQALSNLLSFASPNFNISTAQSTNTPVTQYTTPTANVSTVGSS